MSNIIEKYVKKKEYQDRISQYNLIQCIKQDAYQIYKIINKTISFKLQEEVSSINRDIIQNIMSHIFAALVHV